MGNANSGNPNPSPATRFKPGHTGNPKKIGNGRPNLLEELKAELAKPRKGVTQSTLLIQALVERAIDKKDMRAIKEILDRMEGKSLQPIAVEGSINYSNLTTEQLEQMQEILESASTPSASDTPTKVEDSSEA